MIKTRQHFRNYVRRLAAFAAKRARNPETQYTIDREDRIDTARGAIEQSLRKHAAIMGIPYREVR